MQFHIASYIQTTSVNINRHLESVLRRSKACVLQIQCFRQSTTVSPSSCVCACVCVCVLPSCVCSILYIIYHCPSQCMTSLSIRLPLVHRIMICFCLTYVCLVYSVYANNFYPSSILTRCKMKIFTNNFHCIALSYLCAEDTDI